ncbi:MAG TPA: hypothetical protein VGN00_21130 [Puia sp.]
MLYEREDRVMPAENNFYAFIKNSGPVEVAAIFEEQGWFLRKAGWTELEVRNSWSEICLNEDGRGTLLNGQVAFHPNNIDIIQGVMEKIGGVYQFEFYDEQKNLLLERQMF